MFTPLIWTLALPVAESACPSSFRDVLGGVEGALVAYESADLAGFDVSRAQLAEDLSCLEAILEPGEALQLHLVTGLAAWARQDETATRAALDAVVGLAPDFELQTHVAVLDARLVAVADAARAGPTPAETMVLPLVPWSAWRVDGSLADGHTPVGRPVLLQLSDTRSDRTRTWYLPHGGLPEGFEDPDARGLVAWQTQGPQAVPVRAATDPEGGESPASSDPLAVATAAPVIGEAPAARPSAHSRWDRRPLPLAVGGAALGLAGAVSLFYAGTLRSDYLACQESADCDESQRIDTIVLNQVTGYGGYLMTGTGLALGVGAVLRWRF